jgi:hypothetical protein
MIMKKKFFLTTFVLLCLAILSTSCGEETVSGGSIITALEMTPEDKNETGMGTFTSYAHALSGNAILLCGDDNNKVVRLENFNMLAGPDVYIFISKSNNYSKSNVIEVAKLTSGYMDSYVNLDFNPQAFTSEYKFVLVYCVQYNSLFGFAELQ